jgi:hypothetical protein
MDISHNPDVDTPIVKSTLKFAFLVMYELRCLTQIDKLYKYIIDFYDADIIICCQELEDTQELVKLFDRRVIFKKIYTKPCSSDYFNNHPQLKSESNNWNKESCLQLYINWNEMSHVLEDFKDKYDYFINVRTDIDILLPFPDKHLFETIPKGIYTYDAKYAREWGGLGAGIFIQKEYIIQYLKCTYNILTNQSLCHDLACYNQENFLNMCLRHANITMKYMNNLNFFYIATSQSAYTTHALPQRHYLYPGFIKYPTQVNEVYSNLALWKNGYKWKIVNEMLTLSI